MGNCTERQSVHPVGPVVPGSFTESTGLLQDYEVFINHDALFLGSKGFANKVVYHRLDATSWRNALQHANGIVGAGRIVSVHFSAFLQVHSLAEMRKLLPAFRHVRSIIIRP